MIRSVIVPSFYYASFTALHTDGMITGHEYELGDGEVDGKLFDFLTREFLRSTSQNHVDVMHRVIGMLYDK